MGEKPVVKPAQLISNRQWLFTAIIASLLVVLCVFVQYPIDMELGGIKKYQNVMEDWISTNMSLLWTVFALVGFFFVFVVLNQKRLTFK